MSGHRGDSSAVQISPNDLLCEMKPLVRNSMSRGVDISWDLEPALPDILVERIQFQRMVLNLTVNANTAMPHGGELLIRTCDQPAHPDRVNMSIGDTGNGMSADTVEHIFEPFYTTRPSNGGTGLGLAIVHAIVNQFGGEIAVRSELGLGTTFEIGLPAT